ncbi:MAG: methionyl-tRNA formyltransferase [Armatimonadota bacterium]
MASTPVTSSFRMVFAGTAPFAVPILRALAGAGERSPEGAAVAAVFTMPDRPAGRGRQPRSSAVKIAALELGIPVHQPDRVSRGEGLALIRALEPDLLVVVAFGEIITPEALAVPRLGAVNVHPSLLPRYRGPAPIQRAIMAGEDATGVTVQWMTQQTDAGDVILQRAVEIGEGEDFGSLHDRLALIGAEMAVEAVRLIQLDAAPRTPQDPALVTYAPPISVAELTVVWSRSADEIARLVLALSPRPGARTTRGSELLKVLSARAVKNPSPEGGVPRASSEASRGRRNGSGGSTQLAAGQIIALTSEGFLVATGDSPDAGLLVLRVQPAGRKAMSATDYVKGYRLRPGDRFGA